MGGVSTEPGTELGVTTAPLGTSDVVLTIGPQHPATHGVLRLALRVDGDVIVSAEPVVGFLHRGAEKLFEARDYRQIMVLANRHDWLSAFSNELGVALAVERMLGIEVPPRATWLRTLLAELGRVLSHLVFLSVLPARPDAASEAAFDAREAVQGVMEEISGGRMHYMFNQVGGLKQDPPPGWLDHVRGAIEVTREEVTRSLAPLVREDAVLRAAARGTGVLSRAAAAAYGVSGPVARASGLDLDLRRDEPHLAYSELPAGVLRVVTRTEGDSLARYECLLEQVEVSLDVAAACATVIESLPAGPVNVRLPKVVKAPEGATYCWTESPLGASGYYLVSRGERTPWRLKLRTASFSNVQALSDVLPGSHVADLATILGSFFFVVGDIDK
jgi:NADH-quinone oxidoreductase subunit D